MQQVIPSLDTAAPPLILPPPEVELMAGVAWGHAAEPFTPAFWRASIHQQGAQEAPRRFGSTLLDEAVGCLLSGHGVPAEAGQAAYTRLKDSGLLVPGAPAAEVTRTLQEPVQLPGATTPYRFAAGKGAALLALLARFGREAPPEEARPLRDWLLQSRGIGIKTASWVVRNHLDSDDVAILDTHVHRAGYLMGLFPAEAALPHRYLPLESQFLELARRMEVRTSQLNQRILQQMSQHVDFALRAFTARLQAGH